MEFHLSIFADFPFSNCPMLTFKPSFTHFWQLVFLFFSTPFLVAQSPTSYQPATCSSEEALKDALSSVEARAHTDRKGLDANRTWSKNQRKDIINLYSSRSNKIINEIKEGHYLVDRRINGAVQRTFETVLKSNPDLPQDDLRLFVSRETVPNARCYGEGTLVINIGLLARLQNESQLAFIICHEMAHYVQNHVNKHIKDRITYYYSKETQAELKKIAKTDFRRFEKVQKMFGAALYRSRRHSRERELEADSIGMFFLQNTPYDITEAVKTLLILDEADKPIHLGTIDFKAYFDHPEFPFKDKWIALEDDAFIRGKKYNLWEVDSLKTHPSCQKRYGILSRRAQGGESAFVQPVGQFMEMVNAAEFEMIEADYFYQNYGKCIHECLQYLKAYPDNAYLHARIIACLHHIWAAKIDHELGKVVALPDEEQADSYRMTLTMLYEMSMSEYKNLAFYCLEQHKSTYLPDEHFVYASFLVAEMQDDADGMEKSRGVYRRLFPEGLYATELLSQD